jgi:hypothetical protein
VALGFAAKELIRWEKDGRQAHVFDPPSFPLAVFAVALLLTNGSGATPGQEVAITHPIRQQGAECPRDRCAP